MARLSDTEARNRSQKYVLFLWVDALSSGALLLC